MVDATSRISKIDNQSVKTTRRGGNQSGFDGGKKITGHKRNIITDINGLLMAVKVHNSKSADAVIGLMEHKYERLSKKTVVR